MTETELHQALLAAALVPLTYHVALFTYLAKAFKGEAA